MAKKDKSETKKKPNPKTYKNAGTLIIALAVISAVGGGQHAGGFTTAIVGALIATPFFIKAKKLEKQEK